MKDRCALCDKDTLIEDLYTCEECGKSCCPDCITSQGTEPDCFKNICVKCIEERHD